MRQMNYITIKIKKSINFIYKITIFLVFLNKTTLVDIFHYKNMLKDTNLELINYLFF